MKQIKLFVKNVNKRIYEQLIFHTAFDYNQDKLEF